MDRVGHVLGMARNSTVVAAPRQAVFDVLADGYTYGEWVVGTQRIRDVDAGWPRPEARLHYRAGVGRLTFDDVTTSRRASPPERLELVARGWPTGTVRIDIRLREIDRAGTTATEVTLDEHPLSGPAAWLHNPALDLLIKLRNTETLRRLRRLAEQRARQSGQGPAR